MTKSIREKIYETIRDDITFGKLSPGERLTEKELAERFQSSRNTIRESLRQLESEALLNFEPNRGFRVSKLSIKQVNEIYSLRGLLESYATGLTAKKITARQVAFLEKVQERCKKAAAETDLKTWIKHNTIFHSFFYENCDNENLNILLDTLKRRIYRYQYLIVSIPGHFDSYLQSHEKILEACRRNDEVSAEKHMKYHMNKIKMVLLDHFENFPTTLIG